jgi:hypothetical protein
MTVRIETGDRRYAGTDDDVTLRIGNGWHFPLEKKYYDDFERGDDDTYSVPIGKVTRDGFTVRDIERVAIEKSKDGSAGGWFLKGVTLKVNGREVVRQRGINRWLEKSNRTWTVSVPPDQRTADVVPVWLELMEDDYSDDETGDINEFDRHTSLPLAYELGAPDEQRVTGASRLSGRRPLDDGARARLTYKLTTLTVDPPPPLPGRPVPTTPPREPVVDDPPPPADPPPPEEDPPPPPPAQPDLVITAMDTRFVTVKNQGGAAAAAFTVSVTYPGGSWGSVPISGLAAGDSVTVQYYSGTSCGGDYLGEADSGHAVAESNEDNNRLEYYGVIC